MLNYHCEYQTNKTFDLPNHRRYNKASGKLVDQYYKDTPRETMQKLYSVYKDDFLAFGYSVDGYL